MRVFSRKIPTSKLTKVHPKCCIEIAVSKFRERQKHRSFKINIFELPNLYKAARSYGKDISKYNIALEHRLLVLNYQRMESIFKLQIKLSHIILYKSSKRSLIRRWRTFLKWDWTVSKYSRHHLFTNWCNCKWMKRTSTFLCASKTMYSYTKFTGYFFTQIL